MTVLEGKGVSKGVAIGILSYYVNEKSKIKKYNIEDIEQEVKRFEKAKELATKQLDILYNKALKRVGEQHSLIFQIHQMMLNDLDFVDIVINTIKDEKVNCEYAIEAATQQLSEMFKNMDDTYMQARANDVIDASNKLLDVLNGNKNALDTATEPVILCARDLMPSETIRLDKELLLGFITNEGSSNSHTAILSRTMGIPAIVKVEADFSEFDGKQAIVDGENGKIYIEPDEATIKKFRDKKEKDKQRIEMLRMQIGKPSITKDGKKIDIFANIGSPEDVSIVLNNDADGVGLFRSEFLYLGRNNYPTEEEQFEAYYKVAEKMNGKKVVIRTLDIGADKKVDYFNLPEEENSAMGYRAIRICLDREEIFITQLRAILKASAFGNLLVMFPMIISVDEVIKIKQIIERVKQSLRDEKIDFDENIEIGIMIETPAAAVISDILAKEVDFFSIGTNDLTQYTLAIDRQNQKLENMYNPHHKAVLRLIKMVCDNAHKEGKWVGICGELGSDTTLTETFLAMGIDELSVTPTKVLEVRARVRDINLENKTDIII